ncbi:MAG: signal peptidase I [Woeseiaceae bacterium]|nr:signal peptidase I [Woeseiaceae bacterium]
MTKKGLHRYLRELRVIAIILVGVLAGRSTLADHYYVPSASMEPTLYAGDRVAVDKRAHGLRVPFTTLRLIKGQEVRRGEIVIFDSPRDGKRLIKRIVAVGGDDVIVYDGRLYINGQALASGDNWPTEQIGERLVRLNLDNGGGPDYRQVIPAGKLLAVGDHRGRSLDGRMFGLIDEKDVYGRALGVYYRRGDGFTWRRL